MIEFPTEYFEKIDVEKCLQMMTKKSRKITQHAKSLVTLPTSGAADNFCKQFGPRSGPTQVGPDLDPNCLTLMVFLKDPKFPKRFILKKKTLDKKKKHKN